MLVQLPPHIEEDLRGYARVAQAAHGVQNEANRPDDNEETVRTRLAEYRAKTAPILPYYEERGLVRRVDGMGTPDDVAEEIDAILDNSR